MDDIHRASILIVDDIEANVRLLERMLHGAGYLSLSSTMHSHEVCPLHEKNNYDLIILDLQMPGLTGFDVMECLKKLEIGAYLPVLVITVQDDQKLRALQAGAKDFLSKPINLVEVEARVYNLLEVRLLHNQAREYSTQLEALALKDSLTGLANRRLLLERSTVALAHAKRNNTSMAVIFLDLDGFKEVNDTWGHDAGDLLLQTVARRLSEAVREEDTVARLGGDEFVVALWAVGSAEDAERLGAKLIAAISPPYPQHRRTLTLSASAGIAVYPIHGTDFETLLKNADVAMYEAKRAGKNVCRISKQSGLSPL